MEGAAWPAVACLPGPGLPHPTVTWRGRQPGQAGSPATRAQASLYTCEASNRHGSSSAALTVEILATPTCEWRPPRLTSVPAIFTFRLHRRQPGQGREHSAEVQGGCRTRGNEAGI